MQLRYISIPALVAEAGGDPWAINKSLQAGSPAQISYLAEAFHKAGRCTAEANNAFEQARNRFDAAWNHQNGDHPINDSAEVQRVTKSLGAQSLQLPKIGADLENIAAALAEAQRSASGQITALEGQLQQLDGLIGQALEQEKDPNLSAEERSALNALIDGCERDAIDDTKAALGQLQSIRNGYSDCLQKSLSNLRTEGYDPAAIHGVDADVSPEPSGLQTGELADIRQVTNEAVVDQMAKVRAAQDALNKALAALYTHGPGSPEGEAATASLPKLKADLAHAIDDLGKAPRLQQHRPRFGEHHPRRPFRIHLQRQRTAGAGRRAAQERHGRILRPGHRHVLHLQRRQVGRHAHTGSRESGSHSRTAVERHHPGRRGT